VNNGLYCPPDLTTKEGLLEFAFAPRTGKPERVSLQDYRRYSSAQREAFDDHRLAHIAQVVVKTPLLDDPLEKLKRRIKFNLRLRPGPRPGAVLDSPGGGYGKSTFLLELLRWWVRECISRNPSGLTKEGNQHVPAVYLTLDAGTTVKNLLALLAHALYFPWDDGASEATLAKKVIGGTRNDRTALIQDALVKCQTSLIVVDDLHFLHVHRNPDQLVNEQMKKLASTVPATFVCAGINCLNTGLLWDGLSARDRQWSQTAGRFQRIEVERFRAGSAQWKAVLRALGSQVVLLEAPRDPLSSVSAHYLHERSNGEIGPLVQLIREGVVEAMASGTEKLTEAVLDSITLAYSVEAKQELRTPSKGSARSSASAKLAA
jgi:hypothetical protein